MFIFPNIGEASNLANLVCVALDAMRLSGSSHNVGETDDEICPYYRGLGVGVKGKGKTHLANLTRFHRSFTLARLFQQGVNAGPSGWKEALLLQESVEKTRGTGVPCPFKFS